MSAAATLLARATSEGLELWADGGKLRCRGPNAALDKLKGDLASHKAELLEALRIRTLVISPDGSVLERHELIDGDVEYRQIAIDEADHPEGVYSLLWTASDAGVQLLATADGELLVSGRSHIMGKLLPGLVFRRGELVAALSPCREVDIFGDFEATS